MSTDNSLKSSSGANVLASSATNFVLSAEELAAIHHEMAHYEDARAASIEALKIVQQHRGWVCDEAIPAIAAVLGIGAAELEGVATFYSMIFRRPVGRNVVKLCDSISCFLTGFDELSDAVMKHTGLSWGETSADSRYTLLPVCCLGNCDKGPALMINDDTFGPVAPEDMPALLERYK